MVQVTIRLEGYSQLSDLFGKLRTAINEGMPVLFKSLGDALVENTQSRIISRDKGAWAPASKWARAKTGYNYPTLLGAEKYVKQSISAQGLKVYGLTGKSWTLTQHHEGFENALVGPNEDVDEHGRVTLKIKDPRPLNLYVEFKRSRDGAKTPKAGVFAFVPKRVSHTPARKIWPSAPEAEAIMQPIASKWLAKVASDAGYR